MKYILFTVLILAAGYMYVINNHKNPEPFIVEKNNFALEKIGSYEQMKARMSYLVEKEDYSFEKVKMIVERDNPKVIHRINETLNWTGHQFAVEKQEKVSLWETVYIFWVKETDGKVINYGVNKGER